MWNCDGIGGDLRFVVRIRGVILPENLEASLLVPWPWVGETIDGTLYGVQVGRILSMLKCKTCLFCTVSNGYFRRGNLRFPYYIANAAILTVEHGNPSMNSAITLRSNSQNRNCKISAVPSDYPKEQNDYGANQRYGGKYFPKIFPPLDRTSNKYHKYKNNYILIKFNENYTVFPYSQRMWGIRHHRYTSVPQPCATQYSRVNPSLRNPCF